MSSEALDFFVEDSERGAIKTTDSWERSKDLKTECICYHYNYTLNYQDPFDDIKSVFKHDLNHEEQELLKKELQPYDIDQFIEVFYEFIATHVKNRGENEMDDP